MAIEWHEADPGATVADVDVMLEGYGGSGEKYEVWYGTVFLNPATMTTRWVASGWPEPDSDSLPIFESKEEAIALCERWEEIKLEAEARARAAFTGIRSGKG